MAAENNQRRPGDLIINRYMPMATDAEREAARENLYGFVKVLMRIATRRATEETELAIRASNLHAINLEDGSQPSQ